MNELLNRVMADNPGMSYRQLIAEYNHQAHPALKVSPNVCRYRIEKARQEGWYKVRAGSGVMEGANSGGWLCRPRD